MTESRSHNTEVRLALSKVQDKIDVMSQKVNGFGLSFMFTYVAVDTFWKKDY